VNPRLGHPTCYLAARHQHLDHDHYVPDGVRQLERYLKRYELLAAAARTKLKAGRIDTDAPEIKHAGW
jgi:hypothetical protein